MRSADRKCGLPGRSQGELFDEHASKYSEELDAAIAFAHKDSTFFLRAKTRLLYDLTEQYGIDRTKTKLLDVGCGTGLLDQPLKELGFSVHGTDVSAEALKTAQSANAEAAYALMDGNSLPYRDRVFGVTIAVCVMHHVSRERRLLILSEMRRVTRQGGLVAVIDHNPINPLTRLAVCRCAFDKDAELLSAARARALFRSTGMSPRTKYILFFPFEHPLLPRLEKRLGWLGLGAQYCVYARCE